MNRFAIAAAATIAATATASAGGLDRSNQDIGIIFEEGDRVELSFGYVNPSVSGVDRNLGGGTPASGNVANEFLQVALGYKQQLNEQLSFALIVDQPYGVDILYPVGASFNFGGTKADLSSTSITGMLRYQFNDRVSVHGGVRVQTVDANVVLDGAAYGGPPPGGASGYSVDFDGDTAIGWQIGGAYEIPEIALRVAVTYFSEIDHDLATRSNFNPGTTNTSITTPQAVNLDFQTGVAADTLVFGQVRWADYSELKVRPLALRGTSLTDIDDFYRVTLGVGRQFNEQLSGAVSLTWEDEGDMLVSPLGPTNGSLGITVGATYAINDQIDVTGGVNYTRFGDSNPRTAGATPVAAADFTDNSAVGFGMKVAYKF